jgi:hypothetical protein
MSKILGHGVFRVRKCSLWVVVWHKQARVNRAIRKTVKKPSQSVHIRKKQKIVIDGQAVLQDYTPIEARLRRRKLAGSCWA